MWKQSDSKEPQAPPHAQTSQVSPARTPSSNVREQALIGPSLVIKGDLTGDEDLVIEGRIEGKIELRKHSVTIGKNGHVKADIYGKVITVEGDVQGNLYGDDQLILRQSSTVRGNIVAPRVVLEDGANFKGSIDMSGKETGQPGRSASAALPGSADSGGSR